MKKSKERKAKTGRSAAMIPTKAAEYWREKLGLAVHPEGGFYRQTYRADLVLPSESLGLQFSGPRAASTAIYFLLEGKNFSAFHRLHSDELWHFYLGAPLVVHVIERDGKYSQILLGSDPEAGQEFSSRGQGGMLVCLARERW